MKTSEIFNIFFREKPALMLIALRQSKNQVYASSLAKQIDCTYSHVVKILQELERDGLVSFDKQGRLKLLTLTKKGTEVADHIDRIRQLI
jgi:predicted transcriptional regulator